MIPKPSLPGCSRWHTRPLLASSSTYLPQASVAPRASTSYNTPTSMRSRPIPTFTNGVRRFSSLTIVTPNGPTRAAGRRRRRNAPPLDTGLDLIVSPPPVLPHPRRRRAAQHPILSSPSQSALHVAYTPRHLPLPIPLGTEIYSFARNALSSLATHITSSEDPDAEPPQLESEETIGEELVSSSIIDRDSFRLSMANSLGFPVDTPRQFSVMSDHLRVMDILDQPGLNQHLGPPLDRMNSTSTSMDFEQALEEVRKKNDRLQEEHLASLFGGNSGSSTTISASNPSLSPLLTKPSIRVSTEVPTADLSSISSSSRREFDEAITGLLNTMTRLDNGRTERLRTMMRLDRGQAGQWRSRVLRGEGVGQAHGTKDRVVAVVGDEGSVEWLQLDSTRRKRRKKIKKHKYKKRRKVSPSSPCGCLMEWR